MSNRWGALAAVAVGLTLGGCGLFGDGDVAAGTCLERVVEDGEVTSHVVECDRPHDVEVIGVVEVEGFEGYPGDGELSRWAFERCVAVFEDYVGTSFTASPLDLDVVVPDEGAWGRGATVRCGVMSADGGRRVGSVAS